MRRWELRRSRRGLLTGGVRAGDGAGEGFRLCSGWRARRRAGSARWVEGAEAVDRSARARARACARRRCIWVR